MTHANATPPSSLGALIRREAAEYFTPNKSDRPWQLPLAIAIASGLPVMIGAWLGNIGAGTLASIGAMTIVYLPRTRLDQRMLAVMSASCGMIACYALGQAAQMVPELRVPVIVIAALLVTMSCRFYRVGPPGPLFFVMAAAIGAYAPGGPDVLAEKLGVFALGSVFAVAVAFLYSVHILRSWEPLPLEAPPKDHVGEILTDSVIIALFVGLSLGAADLLGFDKPYWVPVSCLAVMQGSRMRLVWNRQVQRIVGTLVGLVLTWLLFSVAHSPWHFAIAVPVLLFIVETVIVRHYALAAIFITPLTITLAEASLASGTDATPLLIARLSDTVLGSVIGVIGGLCIHHPAIRARLETILRKMFTRKPA